MITVRDRPPNELCEIGAKYGTNKSSIVQDHYSLFYYDLLKDRRHSIKKVLEFGIGSLEVMGVLPNYTVGASLYMWRDFLPNAMVYGADYDPSTLFIDERIRTFFADERSPSDIEWLIQQTGSDIDLFIDDASHLAVDQIFLLDHMMPLLDKGVIYIVEDLPRPEPVEQYLRFSPYNFERVRFQHKRANYERVYMVTHK